MHFYCTCGAIKLPLQNTLQITLRTTGLNILLKNIRSPSMGENIKREYRVFTRIEPFIINAIRQKLINENKDIHLCFIDTKMVFDRYTGYLKKPKRDKGKFNKSDNKIYKNNRKIDLVTSKQA